MVLKIIVGGNGAIQSSCKTRGPASSASCGTMVVLPGKVAVEMKRCNLVD